MMPLDPRVTPARPDLAAHHLRGKVEAARFTAGKARVVTAGQAPVRREPSPDAPLDTEALMGEIVTVYDTTDDGWAWGQLASDEYVGWLPAAALGESTWQPTHKVWVPRTFMFPGASIKLPPTCSVPFGARVAVTGAVERFAILKDGGYIPGKHLVPLKTVERDFVEVAERFLGTPYLWGGRTTLGVDCSGLVQAALNAHGVACPRDTDMQERAIGKPIFPNADLSDLERGDLVFWKGHVAIVRDPQTLIHANAFHMAVAYEPLHEAIARIRESDGRPTSIRRL
jgi:cell wall-associated NlpC family hydrolase